MVVCKFFLQGTCKFGENCKFEHQLNDNRSQHSSVLWQQNFPSTTTAPPTNTNTTVDQNTLIRAVINDTVSAEKGGQWLLSCYAPFKEKPNFPGFEEQSFEEVRWGYYEAPQLGTVDQFKQQFQSSLQQAVMKLRALQNPSPSAINTIKSIYNSAPGTSSNAFTNAAAPTNFTGTSANIFGNNQNTVFSPTNTNSVFGQASNFGNTNVFAQSNQQPSSTAKSIFATANQSLFGGAPQQQQSSIFGNNPIANSSNLGGGGASPFGQPFTGQNASFTMPSNQPPPTFPQQQTGFGAQQQTNTSMFDSQPQSAVSPFSQQQTAISPFSAQPQTGLGFPNQQNIPFGAQPQVAPSLLGAAPQTSIFGMQSNAAMPVMQPNAAMPVTASPPPTESIFTAQPQQSTMPFNPQLISQPLPFVNPTNAFVGNLPPMQAHTTANSHSSSIFGSANTTIVSAPPGNTTDESIYSKIEELSESDIKSYESDGFEFGKIPEKPPTIQMCF